MEQGKEFDMEAGVSQIVEGLGLEVEEPEAEVVETPAEPAAQAAVAQPTPDPAAPVTRTPPQSWSKETHELWTKLPPEAQEQIERREKQMLEGLSQYKDYYGVGKTLSDAIRPYQEVLKQQGVDEAKAVSYLLATHQRLTTGSPEARMAEYQRLGQALGFVAGGAPGSQPSDPMVKDALERTAKLERFLMQKETENFERKREATSKEVEAFAADPAHPYFDDVAEDIIVMIHAGHGLQDAYEKAVWANPVTREKELSRRQQDAEKQLREKAEREAEAARKARSANVRNRDTRKAPTEPLGKMEDTMRETLADIKSRTH